MVQNLESVKNFRILEKILILNIFTVIVLINGSFRIQVIIYYNKYTFSIYYGLGHQGFSGKQGSDGQEWEEKWVRKCFLVKI